MSIVHKLGIVLTTFLQNRFGMHMPPDPAWFSEGLATPRLGSGVLLDAAMLLDCWMLCCWMLPCPGISCMDWCVLDAAMP